MIGVSTEKNGKTIVTVQTGFDYAKSLNADVVVTYDADRQFEPSEIPLVCDPVIKNAQDLKRPMPKKSLVANR